MGIEITWVIGILITIALTVLGAVIRFQNNELKSNRSKIDETRSDLTDFRVEAAQRYVSHDQLSKLEARMDKGFEDIRQMLTEALRR